MEDRIDIPIKDWTFMRREIVVMRVLLVVMAALTTYFITESPRPNEAHIAIIKLKYDYLRLCRGSSTMDLRQWYDLLNELEKSGTPEEVAEALRK